MRLRPRTASRFRPLSIAALALALLQTSALAQQPRGRTPRTAPAQTGNPERARRMQAITLLVETADKARLFEDLFYRAHIQALAADALWPHDERRARLIFRHAWEAATAADKASLEDTEAKELVPEATVREAILEKAAARDAKLADEFLKTISQEKADENSSQPGLTPPHTPWRELSADGERRLDIASILLRQGEAHRAAEIAAPVVNEGVNLSLVEFILALRRQAVNDSD